jgi:hypothetical protein
MAKLVMISSVVSKWVAVPDGMDADDYLNNSDDLFDGIDLDIYDATDFEVVNHYAESADI